MNPGFQNCEFGVLGLLTGIVSFILFYPLRRLQVRGLPGPPPIGRFPREGRNFPEINIFLGSRGTQKIKKRELFFFVVLCYEC
jgi:hypothetical protein